MAKANALCKRFAEGISSLYWYPRATFNRSSKGNGIRRCPFYSTYKNRRYCFFNYNIQGSVSGPNQNQERWGPCMDRMYGSYLNCRFDFWQRGCCNIFQQAPDNCNLIFLLHFLKVLSLHLHFLFQIILFSCQNIWQLLLHYVILLCFHLICILNTRTEIII